MVAPDRDRLRAAFRLGRRDAPASEGIDRRSLRDFLLARSGVFGGGRAVVELPAGEVARSDHGEFWRRELRYPLASRHGDVVLARVVDVDRAHVAAEARLPANVPFELERCLFVDTETTGLAGGAGTVVFAFGLAWIEGDEVVLEQLFLRDFGEEPAMLQHVAARLRARPIPVTYVGKSFDRHRIAARMAVHKIAVDVLGDAHVDLYHIARRRCSKLLPDCRLRTVEQHLLSLARVDDLPGSEAPLAFLSWLRDRTGAVDRVLEHNRIDVLSMVALLAVLGRPA